MVSFKEEAKDKLDIYDFLPVTSSPQEISMFFSAFCHEALQLTIFFCVPIRGFSVGGRFSEFHWPHQVNYQRLCVGNRGQSTEKSLGLSQSLKDIEHMAEEFGLYLIGNINLLKRGFFESKVWFSSWKCLYLKYSLYFKEFLAILEKHDRIKQPFLKF